MFRGFPTGQNQSTTHYLIVTAETSYLLPEETHQKKIIALIML